MGNHIVPQVEKSGSVGVIAVILSIIAVVYIIITWREKRLSPLSPVFWGITTLALFIPVFNIPPVSSIIYQVPVFSSSPNSRLLVFLGLTFSILGAYSFNVISEYSEKKANNPLLKKGIILFFILIIAIQCIDLSTISRSQNAVVPDVSFYPKTPTITYVQQHIEPYQSVLTTSSFLVSGTITYYNIPDWFAHTYHTDKEKKILNNVVSDAWHYSPTAALYEFKQINLNSEVIDTLGIRYILTSNTTPFTGINLEQWKIISVEPGITLFENKDSPHGSYLLDTTGNIETSSQDDIILTKNSPNYRRYSVTSPHSTTFVTTVRYLPGWQAYVNGNSTQIKPHLGMLQSVPLSEGNSTVEFVYVPYSFYLGLLLSIITGIFLILLPKKYFLF
jgi:hypothetical protein